MMTAPVNHQTPQKNYNHIFLNFKTTFKNKMFFVTFLWFLFFWFKKRSAHVRPDLGLVKYEVKNN